MKWEKQKNFFGCFVWHLAGVVKSEMNERKELEFCKYFSQGVEPY